MKNIRLLIGLFLIFAGISAVTNISLTKYLFAFILIYIGLKVMFRNQTSYDYKSVKTTSQDYINEVGIFTAVYRKVQSDSFRGGKAAMIFSGGEIDLSKAKTKEKNIEFEAVAVFSGLKVIVPKDWKVESEGVGIIGGYSNSTSPSGTAKVNLKVRGAAVMGGVEIIN